MPHLRQHLDGRVAALPRHAVLTAHHQNALGGTRQHQLARQHHQAHAGGAAHLQGVGIVRLNAEMLGKDRGQHQVRQRCRVAANQAVDVTARQACVIQSLRAGLAHQVQGGLALVSPVSGQATAYQISHAISPRT